MKISIPRQILDALAKIDRPLSFCASGQLPAMLPGLEVTGVETIALPLAKDQAAALINVARQAPYGKGEETLVDTDVRRVWEIDAKQVVLANPGWPDVVGQAVRAVQSELGLEDQQLDSHLYKLLLYEPGSFFLPHRDGEKLDRMIATLIIALPSAHTGGELVVRHDGREETIEFGGRESQFQTRFAAFYADCEHEVRPVKSGFRLALVYNLTLAKSKRVITAPTSGGHIETLGRIFERWTEENAPQKLAVVLDHKYTEAGLAPDALKGIDRARADALFEAARPAGFDASLALVTLWESGAAEPSGGYGRYGYDFDDDDDGEHVMGEVYDEELTAENFSDPESNRLSFGQIPLVEEEIASEESLREGEPDEEDFEGYTGNAGMTLDRWYRRAAILLWPSRERFNVLCGAGIETAVGGLERMVQEWKNAKKGDQTALKEQCLEFAERIIANWPTREFAKGYGGDKAADSPMLPLLENLDDPSLVANWLRDGLARDASIEPGKTLGKILARHGWSIFRDELRTLYKNTSNETIERNARLLEDWSRRKDQNADRRKLCAELGQEMVGALQRLDAEHHSNDWRDRKIDRSGLLASLVRTFIALGNSTLLKRLVKHVLERPNEYDITTVQVPAILDLRMWLKRNVKHSCPPLHRWLKAIHDELESRAADPPREPADWRRESNIPCTCADCRELSHFLNDPKTKTLRLPLAKQRRQHLHQTINGNKLDLTHVTERSGRPFTLVCTKTSASYERAVQAHQVDLKHLRKSREMLDWQEELSS